MTLEWADGDFTLKTILIELIDGDKYEQRKNSQSLWVIQQLYPLKEKETVFIMGPNDAILGRVGFGEYVYENEGEKYRLPVTRVDGVDETIYASFTCNGETANDKYGTWDNPLDVRYMSSVKGQLQWIAGDDQPKYINMEIIADNMYEENDDLLCEIGMVWSDYSDMFPDKGYMASAITIKSNDNQIKVNSPWVIYQCGVIQM